MLGGRKDAVTGAVHADDLSLVVDVTDRVEVERCVSAIVIDKSVLADIIYVTPDDLSFVVDVAGEGPVGLWEVDNGVRAAAVQEALFGPTEALLEITDKLSLGIDVCDSCVDAAWGINRRVVPVVV